MEIQFATCERWRALGFIKKVYPSRTIEDTPECAGPLLDLVEKDIVRIQDPMMYGTRIEVVPGKKWDDNMREEVIRCGKILESPNATE
jgi:hypothetical protein